MDKLGIKNQYQNDQYNDVLDENDEELYKKCYNQMDQWLNNSESDLLKKRLKILGLCERKGLDGQVMLYPTIKKERKLDKDELYKMVDRLYKVKKVDSAYQQNLNPQAKKSIQQQKERAQKAALLLNKPKNKKQDDIYDDLFFNSNSRMDRSQSGDDSSLI